jgi:hypothetical protein
MMRRWISWATVAVSLLPFSSCTCYQETPEPPTKVAARPGFGTGIATRKLPERVEQPNVPPPVAAAPKQAPTVPPTPQETPQEAKVPENFPAGIPIPEGSEVMAVQHLANDARNVIFSTERTDTPQLFSLYKDSMRGSGWGEPTQQYQGKDTSFLSFKKGDTITNISVSKDPKSGKRIVAVMYYEEQPLPFPEF